MDYSCYLCPRKCGVDRLNTLGFCQAPRYPRVARIMLHPWEEPCICEGAGAGAVFFSGCSLRCVYCQNHEISQEIRGTEMREDMLEAAFFDLAEKGASCLDLVSPTPYLETIISALASAKKKGLALPVVFNSSGYESVKTLRRLEGLIDIYLPDLKYRDPGLSLRYSGAADYFKTARLAIEEMHRQTGSPCFEGEKLKRGVIVRHLVLPGHWRDSIAVLNAILDQFGKEDVIVSLMRQYVPRYRAQEYPEINRSLTSLEYEKVKRRAQEAGFHWVYTQEKGCASTEYIPDFLT